MEIIERSPQHRCPSEKWNTEPFDHENDALTAQPTGLLTEIGLIGPQITRVTSLTLLGAGGGGRIPPPLLVFFV